MRFRLLFLLEFFSVFFFRKILLLVFVFFFNFFKILNFELILRSLVANHPSTRSSATIYVNGAPSGISSGMASAQHINSLMRAANLGHHNLNGGQIAAAMSLCPICDHSCIHRNVHECDQRSANAKSKM